MNQKSNDDRGSACIALLSATLESTGFEVCEFGPDNDPCDQCGKRQCQLYFGNRGYWDSREGDYYCESCVIELHQDNQVASMEVLGEMVRENPDG